MTPTVFIGSSSESLDVAEAIQYNLDSHVNCALWNQGKFGLSRFLLEDFVEMLNDCDFGIFVFAPDDTLRIRGKELNVVRDNVVFELGLFIGRLGRERSFVVVPQNHSDFRLPTDLLGITTATYVYQPDNLPAALGRTCTQIKEAIKKAGPSDLVHVNQGRIARSIEDERARSHLEAISKLHNKIARDTKFSTNDNLMIRAFVKYPMTRYTTALTELCYHRAFSLRSEPRMFVAMEAISCSSDQVRAISIIGDDPWQYAGEDSPFIKINIESAKKGVPIQRIYIVENEADLKLLMPIVIKKKAAGIKLKYGLKKDMKSIFDQTFGLRNVLICDNTVLSYSVEAPDHDGRLVYDQEEISTYIKRFDLIWSECIEFKCDD